LVNFGVVSKILQYQKLGYEIRVLAKQKATHKHALDEFTELWLTLNKQQKAWYRHLLTDKMSIYTRLEMLKAGVASTSTVTTKPKKSLFKKILSIITERR
jgi:hypothetical protein